MQHYKGLRNHQAFITITQERRSFIPPNGEFTYIDLQEADQNLESTKKYAQLSIEFCSKHEHTYWINLTDFMKIII